MPAPRGFALLRVEALVGVGRILRHDDSGALAIAGAMDFLKVDVVVECVLDLALAVLGEEAGALGSLGVGDDDPDKLQVKEVLIVLIKPLESLGSE